MSNFDERNPRPAERLTLAGIAAIIVVGVFVVCVILVLAKSLFPSNDKELESDVNTGTRPPSSSVADVSVPSSDDESSEGGDIVDDSSHTASIPDTSVPDSTTDTSSAASGEVAYLSQTAYLRAAGDENAEPLLSVSAGEQVTVIDRPAGSEYVHVNYIGYDGYIWYGYLN